MRTIFALLALSVVSATPARAQFMSGNDLIELCQSNASACRYYMAGVLDGIIENKRMVEAAGSKTALQLCVPIGVSTSQIADIVVRDLFSQPQRRHLAAAGFVVYITQQAYPCP